MLITLLQKYLANTQNFYIFVELLISINQFKAFCYEKNYISIIKNGGVIRCILISCMMMLFAVSVFSQGINWRISGNNNINENNFLGTTNNHPLILKSNLQEGIRIFTDGTVGIGVSEQHYLLPRLDVNGNVLLRGNWTVLPSGSLGIGTEFPLAQLHTTGTVRFENYNNGFLRVDSEGNIYTEEFEIPT